MEFQIKKGEQIEEGDVLVINSETGFFEKIQNKSPNTFIAAEDINGPFAFYVPGDCYLYNSPNTIIR
jgi:hypothetical protein